MSISLLVIATILTGKIMGMLLNCPILIIVEQPNNFNGTSNCNRNTLEETLKKIIASQNEQNETFKNILKNHDNLLGQLTGKIAGLTNDVQALDGRTKSMEAQVAKIAESQTLILAKFAGKPEPNPVEDVKMMRSSEENAEELDKSHVPEYTYTVADFVKMIAMKYTHYLKYQMMKHIMFLLIML